MDFRSLTYFVTVAQELNLTRAAEKLNMSQPPLSNQIKNLEDELGVQLFIRGKRRLQLTDAGSLLLRRANQMLGLADKTRDELSSMTTGLSGTLFLGTVEGRSLFMIADWIAGFHEEFPNVRFELWNGSGDDVLDQLSHGQADLAVIAAPYDTERYTGFAVGSEPWAALIPKDHPLAAAPGETIPLASLVGQPLIIPRRKSRVEAIYQWFQEIGAVPTVLCELSNYLDAVAMARANAGISIFPLTTRNSDPSLVSKVITDPGRRVDYMLVWNIGQQHSAVAEEFINYVKDCLPEEPDSFAPVGDSPRL